MRPSLSVLLCVLVTACGGDKASSPTAPSPPPPPAPVPACEANHTGWLTFGNRSGSITYDAYLNGSRIATIAPGQSSPTQTVAAAVAQHMIWRVTNTSIVACTADPIVTQCGSQTIGC